MYERRSIPSFKPANPNDTWTVNLMHRVRKHIQDVGYPHRDHECVASGLALAPLKKGCDEAAPLAKMAVTIINDGNMRDVITIANVSMVSASLMRRQGCPFTHSVRHRGTFYCLEHAPLHVGTHFDEDESISTHTRVQVKLGKDEGACQKKHTFFARHSAGFLKAFCLCGVCVGRRTSENEVAYFLHTLSNQGVIFDAASYDGCCHLVPMLRRLSHRNDREFFIPCFHSMFRWWRKTPKSPRLGHWTARQRYLFPPRCNVVSGTLEKIVPPCYLVCTSDTGGCND